MKSTYWFCIVHGIASLAFKGNTDWSSVWCDDEEASRLVWVHCDDDMCDADWMGWLLAGTPEGSSDDNDCNERLLTIGTDCGLLSSTVTDDWGWLDCGGDEWCNRAEHGCDVTECCESIIEGIWSMSWSLEWWCGIIETDDVWVCKGSMLWKEGTYIGFLSSIVLSWVLSWDTSDDTQCSSRLRKRQTIWIIEKHKEI